MKRLVWVIAMMILTYGAQGFAADTAKTGAERTLDFQRYDSSYFERNDTGLTAQTSYLVVTSQAQFDRTFGAAPTMGQNNFLPKNIFNTKVVIATIAKGHFLRTYDHPNVTVKDGKIYVWFEIRNTQQESATFASPLILAVDKGQYSEVVFMENGRRVGAATVPRTN
jgi:hypothetical protein